jgi:HTH-type transcriptional regulator / antitoxin HigA
MVIKVLKSEEDYDIALARADELFDAMPDTTEGDELELLLLVIKDYEDKYHSVPPPDPIEAIKLTMQEKGLKAKDLAPGIGSKSYVSQILIRKKRLTGEVMKALHKQLGIPGDILLVS